MDEPRSPSGYLAALDAENSPPSSRLAAAAYEAQAYVPEAAREPEPAVPWWGGAAPAAQPPPRPVPGQLEDLAELLRRTMAAGGVERVRDGGEVAHALALGYAEGSGGLPADPPAAAHCWAVAAAAGQLEAINCLGACHRDGFGVALAPR